MEQYALVLVLMENTGTRLAGLALVAIGVVNYALGLAILNAVLARMDFFSMEPVVLLNASRQERLRTLAQILALSATSDVNSALIKQSKIVWSA